MVMFATDIEFDHPGIEGIITFEAGVFYDIIIHNFRSKLTCDEKSK